MQKHYYRKEKNKMAKARVFIDRRESFIVNTDPQRRVYNGCMFSSEIVKGGWKEFHETTEEKAESQLKFWQELNQIAVDARGEEAKTEYQIRRVQND